MQAQKHLVTVKKSVLAEDICFGHHKQQIVYDIKNIQWFHTSKY